MRARGQSLHDANPGQYPRQRTGDYLPGDCFRIGEMNELYVVVWTKRLRKGSAINASRSWILWKNPVVVVVVVPQRCFS